MGSDFGQSTSTTHRASLLQQRIAHASDREIHFNNVSRKSYCRTGWPLQMGSDFGHTYIIRYNGGAETMTAAACEQACGNTPGCNTYGISTRWGDRCDLWSGDQLSSASMCCTYWTTCSYDAATPNPTPNPTP